MVHGVVMPYDGVDEKKYISCRNNSANGCSGSQSHIPVGRGIAHLTLFCTHSWMVCLLPVEPILAQQAIDLGRRMVILQERERYNQMATTVKTAISIQKSLFEQAESLAHELHVSRSELFGLAIETFVKNHQNQRLLQEINKAYSGDPDPGEQVRLSKMRKLHRKVVRDKW
jgi:hypothetical protein